MRGPTFYDTCLNLGYLFLYLSTTYKFVLSLLPKINFQNLAVLSLYLTFVISFGISVKECKFTENLFGIFHRYSTPSSICRAASQGLLKVIHVSCIKIFIICIQILYTNKTVRLYYRAPTMRNGSETVIRTIASGLDRISDYTTSSTNYRPRSMTCVCFAKPSSLGVTEPFLTQKPG